MFNFTNSTNGTTSTFYLEGRLDTVSSPQLEEALKPIYAEAETLVLDFAKLEYISSAGLRVLLSAQKKLQKKGGTIIKNANSDIKEIFEVTGFADILTVE